MTVVKCVCVSARGKTRVTRPSCIRVAGMIAKTRNLNLTAASSAGVDAADAIMWPWPLTPKPNLCPKMHQWQKLGENPSIDTGDIVEAYSLGRTDGSKDRGAQNTWPPAPTWRRWRGLKNETESWWRDGLSSMRLLITFQYTAH